MTTAAFSPTSISSNSAFGHSHAAQVIKPYAVQTLVVIDAAVADREMLAAGVVEGADVLILQPNRDGVVQISKVLRQYSDLVNLHIISHGSPGCLYLGNTRLSLETLDRYAWDLTGWFSSRLSGLSARHLSIYACNVAANETGIQFLEKLHYLTEAAIYASSQTVGDSAQGATWNLDTVIASVADAIPSAPLHPATLVTYPHTLPNTWTSIGKPNSDPGELFQPRGTVTDSSGNVYVVDTYNNRVQKFDSNGNFLFAFGSLGSGNGQFYSPQGGITIDSSGNVYVVDTNNNRVQKFDSNGNYLAKFGSYGSGNGQFNYPYGGITIDNSGNVYVVDTQNNRVQKFDSSGTYVSQFGSYGSGSGQFNSPQGITIDSSGNVYVVDSYNHRVQKFDSSGNYLAKFGSYGSGNGQFYSPQGITIDSSGNVYVVDTNNNRVQKFDSNGNYLAKFGSYGSGSGQFNYPQGGITIDSSGNVYVVDTSNNRVQKFNSSGTFQLQIDGMDNGQFYYPRGAVIDNSGNYYVVDTNNHRVQKFDSSGNFLFAFGSYGNGNGQFNYPQGGITIDSSGNVYVVDTQNHRVQKFDSSGNYLAKFGSYGSGNGQFYSPSGGIAIDSSGNVYVVDSYNHRVQKFDSSGNFLFAFGSNGSGNGQFNYPQGGITIDSSGNVYVVDTNNNRVQKFDSSGTYVSQFGSNGVGNGQFNYPYGGITIDSSGNVYVVDSYNHRVQKFDGSGTYVSQFGSYGSTSGRFNSPSGGIMVDSSGNVYVVDTYNNRVQKLVPNKLPTSANNTVTTNEDTDKTFAATDFAFTDADDATLQSIKITALPTQGTLYRDGNGNGIVDAGEAVALNQIIAASNINQLKIKPGAEASGTPYTTFSFQVGDGTDYSASQTMTVNVNVVDDAPVVTKNAISVNEGNSVTVTNAMLGATDVDSPATDIVYILASVPAQGVLKRNGTALAVNDSFTQDDINNNLITYTHNGSETTRDSFTFKFNNVNFNNEVLQTDFSSQPSNTNLYSSGSGSGIISGGQLQLTNAVNDTAGAFVIGSPGVALNTFTASFDLLIGGGSGADGFSFNYAGNIPNSVSYTAEEGVGTGLSVTFDSFSGDTGFDVRYNGVQIGFVAVSANTIRTNSFVPVNINVDATGKLTLTHNGNTIFNNLQIPAWSPQASWRFGLAARTGGLNDKHYVDNLKILAPTALISITPVNDAPSFTGDATLAAINEDAATINGNTVSNLFGSKFSDPDTGASLSGVAVISNNANAATEGKWQLSVDNGASWRDVGIVGDGSPVGGLALSASTRLRFVPVANYNGTPTGLVVRALDNSYSGTFATNSTNTFANTSAGLRGGTTPISDNTSILNTSITAVAEVTSVSATTANGIYNAGDTISLTVTFDEVVNVIGAPQLTLETGTTDAIATYTGGSGTNTLTFTYTVAAGENSIDLDYVSTSALTLNGGTITNTAGTNANLSLPAPGAAGSLGANKAIVIDTVAPTITSVNVPTNGNYVAGQTLDFTVNFSEAVTIDTTNGTPTIPITLDSGAVNATYVSGNGTAALVFRYTVVDSDLDVNGIVVGNAISLNGSTIKDVATNDAVLTLNNVTATTGVQVDAVIPTVSLTSAAANTINGTFSVTATFSEDVNNFVIGDVSVGNGSVSNFTMVDAKTYTFDITPSSDGTVTVNIAANVAQDGAGNNNTAATQLTRTADLTAPTVSLTSNSATTVNGVFSVTATFSEDATGFDVSDVIANNGTVGNFVIVDAKTYTFEVTPTTDGAVTVDIAANAAQDGAGNNNTAATQLTRTADLTAPTVSLISNSATTVNGVFSVTAIFSEDAIGFTASDVTVNNGTVGNFTIVDAKTYTFDVTPSSDGTVTVNVNSNVVQDDAGNNNTAATQLARTADLTAPTVSLTSASATNVNGVFSVTATFSEDVANFVVGDIVVGNGTISNFTTVDAKTYTFDVTPATDGTVTINVAANVSEDGAGNGNTAAVQLSRVADLIKPTVSLASTAGSAVNGAFNVTATFSEDVTGFTASDLVIGNGSVGNFQVVDAKTYTFEVNPTTDGTVTVDINAGVAQDVATNNNTAADQLSRTADFVVPTVVLSSGAPATVNTGFSVTATFSEDVADFIADDVSVNNGTVNNFVKIDAKTYTFDIIPDTDGTVTIDVNPSVAQDSAGNNNTAAQLTRTYDSNTPLVTSIKPSVLVLKDASVGENQFSLTVLYNEAMDTGSTPVISFPTAAEDPVSTLTFTSGNWTDASTYVATFTVADANITMPAIDVQVEGATDISGNLQATQTIADLFSIDSANPTVTLASGAANTVNRPFSVTASFSESMTGFTAADVTLQNGTISNFSGSGATYTFTVNPIQDGQVTVGVAANVAQDPATNGNIASVTLSRNFDATAPTLSSAPMIVVGDDTGFLNQDGITKNNKPGLKGIAEAESTVQIFAGQTLLGSTTADATGQWMFTPTIPLADGQHAITFVATDLIGNVSSASQALDLVVDTVTPAAVVVSINPDIRESSVDAITIQFSEAISQFDVSDLALLHNGSTVSLSGAKLSTVDNQTWKLENLPNLTELDGRYQLTVISNGITDRAGNILTADASDSWLTGRTATPLSPISFGNQKRRISHKGSSKADRLYGTPFNDVFKGLAGNDSFISGTGTGKPKFGVDRLFGGDGNDVLISGKGKDWLDGGKGKDRLKGGDGSDYMLGGSGDDRLLGGKGDDVIVGGEGNDTLVGNAGKDTFVYANLTDGVDKITDFDSSADLIDLRTIFAQPGFENANAFAQFVEFVKLEQMGADVQISVDADGNGTGQVFTALATLQNVSASNISSRNFVIR